ncbi:hypothetical protein BD560DRAFT_129625 [Blakeslea trispora]|nr:hypothetical protein BD560DRAFT_129625 [Blakeslea trispora]
MHRFLHFHYGPHWTQGHRAHRHTKPTVRLSDIHACLSQLPFIQHSWPIRSTECLCTTEQVQLNDDLRARLMESMIQSCQSCFSSSSFFKQETWSGCYLFAREKLVAEIKEEEGQPEELIYFLRLLVSHYLLEKHESSFPTHTLLPQSILSSKESYHHDPMASSDPVSSLAYVYDASSTTPFKMREKSSSSATVVSSDSSVSYWTPRMDLERVPSNVLRHPMHTQAIADILLTMDDIPVLSSSVPSEGLFPISPTRSDPTYCSSSFSSAPSSPTHRSRSQSLLSEDSSLKHRLTHHLTKGGDQSYIEDVKLVRRWIENGHAYLAHLVLVFLQSGLCVVVVYREEESERVKSILSQKEGHGWKPKSSQIKQFKTSLKDHLQDFYDFLLTKEATHFTNLSFALTYPGLVHFIHLNQHKMTAPSLVDLNELDTHHELLHQVYSQYSTDPCPWVWPRQHQLEQLCHQLLKLGYQSSHHHMIQLSKDKAFYFLYHRLDPQQALFAVYFNMATPDRLWRMHHRLFQDINQRI